MLGKQPWSPHEHGCKRGPVDHKSSPSRRLQAYLHNLQHKYQQPQGSVKCSQLPLPTLAPSSRAALVAGTGAGAGAATGSSSQAASRASAAVLRLRHRRPPTFMVGPPWLAPGSPQVQAQLQRRPAADWWRQWAAAQRCTHALDRSLGSRPLLQQQRQSGCQRRDKERTLKGARASGGTCDWPAPLLVYNVRALSALPACSADRESSATGRELCLLSTSAHGLIPN